MATPCSCDTFNANVTINGNLDLVAGGAGTLHISPANLNPPSTPALRITDGATGVALSGNPLRLNWDAPLASTTYFSTGQGGVGMTLAGNGQVGVGTTSPGYTLDILGPDAATSGLRVGTAGFVNLPPRLGVTNGVVLSARGLNVVSDGASLGGGPSSGVGITVNRTDAALGVRNDSGPAAIFPAGFVGIGAASPNVPLEINGNAELLRLSGRGNEWLTFENGATEYGQIGVGQNGSIFTGAAPNLLAVRANGALHLGAGGDGLTLTIAGGGGGHPGQVGIGTTASQQALDVAGTIHATGMLMGGDILLSGALKDSTGQYTHVDAGGCYDAS